MFYEQLKKVCKDRETSITAVLKRLGIGTANGTYWKNGSSPSSDIVIQLAEFLNVSTDYLLIGKEEKPIIKQQKDIQQLNSREKELLIYFRELSEEEQIRLVARAEVLAEQAKFEESVG